MKKNINTTKKLIETLKEKEMTLVLAESCTGGLIASMLTEVPGASNVLWGCFVCYTPKAKINMLEIEDSLLEKYGLVSAETAKAMAIGALRKSGANIAASCTGLAGPGTDGSSTPVGTVWIAIARNTGEIEAKEYFFEGSRTEVRQQAANKVLEMLNQLAKA